MQVGWNARIVRGYVDPFGEPSDVCARGPLRRAEVAKRHQTKSEIADGFGAGDLEWLEPRQILEDSSPTRQR
jgi:hypothetical protein